MNNTDNNEEKKTINPSLNTQENNITELPEMTEEEEREKQRLLFAEMSHEDSASDAELQVEENVVKIISPGKMVLKRFFRSKLSMIGLITLLALFIFSFIGPFLSPWGESQMDDRYTELKETQNSFSYMERMSSMEHLDQLAYKYRSLISYEELDPDVSDSANVWTTNMNLQRLYKAVYPNGIAPEEPLTAEYNGKQVPVELSLNSGTCDVYFLQYDEETDTYSRVYNQIFTVKNEATRYNFDAYPSKDHWLGTDKSSYDVFTRLMYGGRISLTLGFVVIVIQTLIGVAMGGIAGYFGKWADLIIMRIIDILYCLPSMPILMIFSAILDGAAIDVSIRIYVLMGFLSLIGWSGTARTVRGQILYLREQEFMIAAEALGISVTRRIGVHLVPNILPLLIVSMTLGLGGIILTEATLSFLNLGVRPPAAAWGTMINTANDPIVLQRYPNQWIPAGIMIVLAVLAFNFVGDGLRDAFDPKARR
jgi:peptide/nickel transport system permease protein